ncbi:uncharacterized protein GIQ15_06703 [Arthroderma uncinatum]|uniref:uncharacterized protein n=1 Tax=Arthroderma uncinatum TaxID=74035 RepID=UPI00144AA7EB|nr:uncharacterized protein GIQ15_06703 [Arthroderma uncinatum]KAF3479727.1 hypothetical protein GIQ15_06703 [Arthroderma uncinatum]
MEGTEKTVPGDERCASLSKPEKRDDVAVDRVATDISNDITAEDGGSTQDVEARAEEAVYSSFSKSTKIFILMMATFSSLFSPVSTTIYLPALTPLSADLKVSNTLINLTLTTYMIFQAISPSFFGDFADTSGRRPAYITTFGVYLAANIGLALQHSYAALLVLRCLQSAGSSATIAITMGVMADIATVSERGRYVGMVLTGTLAGPALGPVLGGVLVQFLGWRSTFWFLVIGAGVFLVPYTLFVPETCRNVVGDGSVKPPWWWSRTLIDVWKGGKGHRSEAEWEAALARQGVKRRPARFPNPLQCAKLVLEKDIGLLLFVTAVLYGVYYVMLTSVPSLYKEIYGFNEFQVGLCFLPSAAGGVAASFSMGHLLDWKFKRIATSLGLPVDRKRAQNIKEFPIERARITVLFPFLYAGMAAMIGYGWALDRKVMLAGPLILQFVAGFCMAGAFTSTSTLLVDLYPSNPSAVTAASNLTRCMLGAAATASFSPMIERIGVGWCFTVWCLVTVGMTPGLWAVVRWGPGWREERRQRDLKVPA